MADEALERKRVQRGRVLSALAGGGLALVLGLVIFGAREIHRGGELMERSDEAFHKNDLIAAITHARAAGLSYVPGAAHVRAAEERLEAIARGAEAQGDRGTARRAWDALRVVDEETSYPGRGRTPAGDRAREALGRLDGLEGGASR